MTYYHSDGLSSILKMTDATGDVTRAYRYDSFGRIESGSSYDGYSFTGWEWDSQTSLYFYRGRYYDPTLGRFLNEDPIGLLGGINLYTYVGNDPTNYVDPAGFVAITAGSLLGGIALGPVGWGILASSVVGAGIIIYHANAKSR